MLWILKLEKQNGQNWWCSLFPILCFTDVSNGEISSNGKSILEKNLDKEQCDILLNKSPKIKLKFKLIELLNK